MKKITVFVNDIHNHLMKTSVNPEMSCIRMESGPALFISAREGLLYAPDVRLLYGI